MIGKMTLLTIFAACAGFAQAPVVHPRAFDSPDAAAKALIDAAAANDTAALAAILGSSSKGILTSGNSAQDQEERQEFAKLAAAKNHIEHSSMDSRMAVLLVGNEDWPYPVPLVRDGKQWRFDPESGAMEVRARRIGADELDAIEICMGYVGAQEAYAAQRIAGAPAYAQRIMSSPNGKDGLYQAGAANLQLVPQGFARADASLPAGERKPYHGYYFRILKAQGPNAPGGEHKYVAGAAMIGGFALIAWPAEYGVTGIHTFIVNQDGQTFEKDLGPRTATGVLPIGQYDPDSSWTVVD